MWTKFGTWYRKAAARRQAQALRAPGEGRVRARVVRRVTYEVQWARISE
ncbi:MAG: hypothetical protein KGJ13_11990 [Patescibacteria group bacterium]|nr:hypothetical protein [Patescibacteria group bacterium]